MKKSELEAVLKKIAKLADSVSAADDSDEDDSCSTEDESTVTSLSESEILNVLRSEHKENPAALAGAHVYGKSSVCQTDTRGHAQPDGRSPLELVVDATDGFVPLWAKGVTLRWRFNDRSVSRYFGSAANMAKNALRSLLGNGISAWGDAAPVRFTERGDAWDFEIVVMNSDDCDANGCVLASAFFPDAGRHELRIYPKMFSQSYAEMIETLAHEFGHVFGLRHFFANVSETAWPSEIFGTHDAFSIMNYGAKSMLTGTDKADLKELYRLVWNGELTKINGTPIKLFQPYSVSGSSV